jgi:threonine dehydratase
MAGNGTIGLEILDDLPDPDRVLVPFGGGGLSTGIASAVKALRPEARVYAVEPETGAPLAAAFESGDPEPFEYRVSFVDGSGSPGVLPAMWPRAQAALDGAFAVSLDETAEAVRLLAGRARVVAEGAGALALAAALQHRWDEKVVCIVSGGNIDAGKLAQILAGETP